MVGGYPNWKTKMLVTYMKYREIQAMSYQAVRDALVRSDPEELAIVVISAALYGEYSWAVEVCIELARHLDKNVRGNALLGFGHLVRIHRMLDRQVVEPLVSSGLFDQDDYVRGQANAARDDIEDFWDGQFQVHLTPSVNGMRVI